MTVGGLKYLLEHYADHFVVYVKGEDNKLLEVTDVQGVRVTKTPDGVYEAMPSPDVPELGADEPAVDRPAVRLYLEEKVLIADL